MIIAKSYQAYGVWTLGFHMIRSVERRGASPTRLSPIISNDLSYEPVQLIPNPPFIYKGFFVGGLIT